MIFCILFQQNMIFFHNILVASNQFPIYNKKLNQPDKKEDNHVSAIPIFIKL